MGIGYGQSFGFRLDFSRGFCILFGRSIALNTSTSSALQQSALLQLAVLKLLP